MPIRSSIPTGGQGKDSWRKPWMGPSLEGCRHDKARRYQHRAESFCKVMDMQTFVLASSQIMPHDIVVRTGDIHLDGAVLAILAVAWLIRKKR